MLLALLTLVSVFAQPILVEDFGDHITQQCGPGWDQPCEQGWGAIGSISYGTCTTPPQSVIDGSVGALLAGPGPRGIVAVRPLPAVPVTTLSVGVFLHGAPQVVTELEYLDANGGLLQTASEVHGQLDPGYHELLLSAVPPAAATLVRTRVIKVGPGMVLIDHTDIGAGVIAQTSDGDDDGGNGGGGSGGGGGWTDSDCQAEVDSVCDDSLCGFSEEDCETAGGNFVQTCLGTATPDGTNCTFSVSCNCVNMPNSVVVGLGY